MKSIVSPDSTSSMAGIRKFQFLQSSPHPRKVNQIPAPQSAPTPIAILGTSLRWIFDENPLNSGLNRGEVLFADPYSRVSFTPKVMNEEARVSQLDITAQLLVAKCVVDVS
jgi:hypothetical protein